MGLIGETFDFLGGKAAKLAGGFESPFAQISKSVATAGKDLRSLNSFGFGPASKIKFSTAFTDAGYFPGPGKAAVSGWGSAGSAAWRIGAAGAQYAGYQAAATYLDRYSQDEGYNPATRGLVGVAQAALRYKSYQGAAGTLLGGVSREVDLRAKPGGFVQSTFGRYGSARSLVNKGGLYSLATTAAGFGAKGLAAYGKGMAKGPGEYGRLLKAAWTGKGWMEAASAVGHPISLPMTAGLIAGASSAYLNKYGMPGHPAYPQLEGPMSMDQYSHFPVNPGNFGQGISMGASAIRSPDVMMGQGTITRKMLRRRAV